jgi:hypothetical protein
MQASDIIKSMFGAEAQDAKSEDDKDFSDELFQSVDQYDYDLNKIPISISLQSSAVEGEDAEQPRADEI